MSSIRMGVLAAEEDVEGDKNLSTSSLPTLAKRSISQRAKRSVS